MVAILQFLPHFHKRDGALVTENQWKALEVPAIHLAVVRALLDQLDERRANPRSIDSGQHLTRAGTRSRHSLHLQVTEANPIQNQCAHIRRNRCVIEASVRSRSRRQMGIRPVAMLRPKG